ncbi:HNH endonuclease signature motif containing protein [Nocardioides nematodiphilus]|uniref:HNH endonuclease signature motif containing protein n=1 Tax=Nocardioides nematodiphilus TaxID=2849669 RepID=UPI001CD97D11|nr:HNH endonuclease signature motif containing protein [Nocardioides nematodiphilus]MCA1984361.1 HNH endonuclease [Nocardioides nematodiphilus]
MHRIMEAVSGLRAAVTSAADANPVFLSTADKRAAILELVRVKSQVAELLLRIEAAASDVADEECARDVGAMLVASGAYDPVHARREYRLSRALERWEVVRAGLAAGAFTEEHAEVIVRALDELPEEATGEDVVLAEKQLCEWAETFTPSQLRRLGRTILAVIDPEAGEAAEARALLRLEQDAADRARLSIRQMGDGTTRIQALVPDAIGVRLKTLLESFTQPRVAALNAEGLRVRNDKLMAEALGAMLERIDPTTLPKHGGVTTSVVVTIGLEQLRREVGVAELVGTDTLLSATETRRIACEAGIIPMVLGGDGRVLDLGRTQRLFSPSQRKAMWVRDKTCRAEGCTVPAAWCDAHHLTPWSRGGMTDIKDGLLYCGFHHQRAHDPRYAQSRLPTGDYRFHLRR